MKSTKKRAKSPSKCGICVLVGLAIWGTSCRDRPPSGESSQSGNDKTVATAKIQEADQLYSQRDDLSKVRLSIATLRQARVADYANFEAAWKLAKFNYYLGAHTDDERERDSAFREGIDSGKVAVELQNDKAEGHFWLGANYGGSAEHSTLAGLATVEDIKREMDAVLRIDEGYQAGSAYLALGQLYLQAPRLLGGDPEKAIGYLEKGLRFGSNNALLRLRLAEAYHGANRDADARKQLDYILAMTPNPEYMAEYKQAVAEAGKLREKIDRH